jgi:hypothetical protein
MLKSFSFIGDADFTGTAGELRVTADLEIEVQTEFETHPHGR